MNGEDGRRNLDRWSPEALDFLQCRVAAFGRMVTVIGLSWVLVQQTLDSTPEPTVRSRRRVRRPPDAAAVQRRARVCACFGKWSLERARVVGAIW